MPCVPCANELSWTCYPILAPLAPPLGRASKLEAGIDFILNAAHLVHVQSSPLNHDQFPFLREKWSSFSRKRSDPFVFFPFCKGNHHQRGFSWFHLQAISTQEYRRSCSSSGEGTEKILAGGMWRTTANFDSFAMGHSVGTTLAAAPWKGGGEKRKERDWSAALP